MRTKVLVATTAMASVVLLAGCSSGGPGGGPGGQQVTAVNLNTNGASPGGANTAEVATAVNAFLATLDPAKRDRVEYGFTENQARQTWSNFPATAVPRMGIVLADLTPDQLNAAYAALRVAQSVDGAQQDTNIQRSDDYLASLGGQGADGFGALKDYYVAVYGTPSPTEPFMLQFGGHHLARNLTYNGDRVSQTPQFVGTEPTSFVVDGATVEPVRAERRPCSASWPDSPPSSAPAPSSPRGPSTTCSWVPARTRVTSPRPRGSRSPSSTTPRSRP